MNTNQIEEALIELLRKLQNVTSEQQPVEITGLTVPLSDLAFFDSLLGLELTVALEERLEISIEDQTVFSNQETEEALSISQIAERLAQSVSGAGV